MERDFLFIFLVSIQKSIYSFRYRPLSPDDFNNYFAQIGKATSGKLQNNSDTSFTWKGPASIYKFRFNEIHNQDVSLLLKMIPNRSYVDAL